MSEKVKTIELSKEPLQRVLRRFNEDLGVYINDDQRNKLGKVLTIIDASIADPVQRKAIKDLISNGWWGGDNMRVNENPMDNPHIDLRGICQLFGFELYEQSSMPPAPFPGDQQEQFATKRYAKIANEQ